MKAAFLIEQEKCTECERCMAACAIAKTGMVQLRQSRIAVRRQWPEVPAFHVCRFEDCDGHPCIAACPTEAISMQDGLVLIEGDACTACGQCVEQCPYGAISLPHGGVAVKCDFCGGDPACVKACVTSAITVKGA